MDVERLKQEQLRHQYLAALGVTSWLPRTALPGAPAPADWVAEFLYGDLSALEGDEDHFDEPHSIGEPSVVTPRKPLTSAPVSSKDLHLDEPKKPFSSTAKTDAVSSPAPRESTAPLPAVDLAKREGKVKPPRFKLVYWVFDKVIVIDSLPPQSRGSIGRKAYQTLCCNMLRAMGLSAQLRLEPYTLNWPMLVGEGLDQGPEEASKAVRHKISKLLREHQPDLILLLGEASAQMVMNRSEALDELRGVVFSYSSKISAISTLSFTQMMQIPECKKEVWADLQKVLPLDV